MLGSSGMLWLRDSRLKIPEFVSDSDLDIILCYQRFASTVRLRKLSR